ncbi:hypothetical protein [Azospirillum sp. TSO22-1]|uniref:hypothetical protein n=1 Tax=Azospirillum sp. TSO22-1 TaxID=716789 RepID=UPI0018EE501D|nr:hypothetical protein [Azospirillum sp. TSO22-1]
MTESQWIALVGLLMVAVLVVPGALRRTRGRVLPYAAAWLAIVAALIFVYTTFGPF